MFYCIRILYYITFSISQNIYNNKGNVHENLNSPHLFVCLGSFSFISLALLRCRYSCYYNSSVIWKDVRYKKKWLMSILLFHVFARSSHFQDYFFFDEMHSYQIGHWCDFFEVLSHIDILSNPDEVYLMKQFINLAYWYFVSNIFWDQILWIPRNENKPYVGCSACSISITFLAGKNIGNMEIGNYLFQIRANFLREKLMCFQNVLLNQRHLTLKIFLFKVK